MRQWFVVHTKARGEQTALWNLARQGFKGYLPQYLRRRRHARRTDWIKAPLFPRYVFVEMDLEFDRWRAVASTIGVTHIICHGDAPAPLPSAVIKEICSREDDKGVVAMDPAIPFDHGDVVKITSGPFVDQAAWFECVDDETRVVLLLDMLGRKIEVRVPMEAVEAFA